MRCQRVIIFEKSMVNGEKIFSWPIQKLDDPHQIGISFIAKMKRSQMNEIDFWASTQCLLSNK